MRSYYFIFAGAVLFDLIISPWLWGAGWLPKLVLVVLPFAFIFLPTMETAGVFAVSLLYFRSASDFNMGLIFLALVLFLTYERRFIVGFFHKTAWQTMIFSGGGILIFYIALYGLAAVLSPGVAMVEMGTATSAVLETTLGVIANFLFVRAYRKHVV